MVFHRLRVISFSKSLLNTKVSSRKHDGLKVHNNEKSLNVEVLAHKEQHDEKHLKATKCELNSSRPLDPLPVRLRLEHNSKSETFRIPSKTWKNHTTRRALSLSDLKRRLSLRNTLSSNRMKQKLQSLKKQKASKRLKRNDVKVLYVAETRHRSRRRSNKHHRKHDDNNMPQSTCNLFGFCRSKRVIDQYTDSHKKDNPFQKLKTRSIRKRKKIREASTNCTNSHHSLKVVTSGRIKVSHSDMAGCCRDSLHYNLLCFPQISKSKVRQKSSSLRLYRSEALANKNIGCYYSIDKNCRTAQKVSRGQAISTSYLKAPVVSVMDAAVSTCNGIKPLASSKSCKVKTPSLLKSSKNEYRKCKRATRIFPVKMIYSKIFHKLLTYSASAHSRERPSARTIVKFILISLVALAWSPCIFGVGIGWLVSYPLRPPNVLSVWNRKKCNRNHYCDTQCKNDRWAAFISYTRRAAKESKKALSSLLPLKEQNEVPHCRPHPNPKRRYTLFHADGRGWVIKPVHADKRSSTKQNRLKEIFQNLFCNFIQRTSMVKRGTASCAGCSTCGEKSVPEKQLDPKRDCLYPSKSMTPQKPKTTGKPSAQPDVVCKSCQNVISGKILNTNQKDKACSCSTPSKPLTSPQNKGGIPKPCLLGAASLGKTNVSGKLVCICQNGTGKLIAQPDVVCKSCQNVISGKILNTNQKDKACSCSTPSKPLTTPQNRGGIPKPCLLCAASPGKTNVSGKLVCNCQNGTGKLIAQPDAVCKACQKVSGKIIKPNQKDKECTTLLKPFTTLQNKGGNSKPCLRCAASIWERNISGNLVQTSNSGEHHDKIFCKFQFQNVAGKPGVVCKACHNVSEKLLNTNQNDKVCTSPSKPSASPQNKREIAKPSLTCSASLGKTNVSGKLVQIYESDDKKSCKCQRGTNIDVTNRENILCSTSSRLSKPPHCKPSAQDPNESTSKSVSGNKTLSEKLVDTIREYKAATLDNLNPNENIQLRSRSKIEYNEQRKILDTNRSRSATRTLRRDPEMVHPIPIRSRSVVSKKNESLVRRSSMRPNHTAIIERGPITSSAGDPTTVIIGMQSQNTQTDMCRKKGSPVKKTQTKIPRKAPAAGARVPPKASRKRRKGQPKVSPKKPEKKIPFGQRLKAWFSGFSRKTSKSVSSIDNAFPEGVGCADLYIYTLRARPCFWIYTMSHSFYPYFLKWYYCSKSCFYHCMFSISLCFWAPIACWSYICYQLCSWGCAC